MRHIIIDDTLARVGMPQFAGYLCHAYCYDGYCTFERHNTAFRFEAGDCMILPRRGDLVENLHESNDFHVSVIYVTQEFIEQSTPQSNYGMKGHLALFQNPIMRLTPEMHASEFVLTHMTGLQQSKREYIQAIGNGMLNYYSAQHQHIQVTVKGEQATLVGQSRVLAAVFGGGRHTWPLQLTFTLAKRGRHWLLTSCQASTY